MAKNQMPSYVPPEYRYWIRQASKGTNLPEPVVAAQINDESGFNPDATSPAGAEGFAQFLPSTYSDYGGTGSEYVARNELKPYIKFTNANLQWAGGDVAKALAAYNAGQGNWQAGQGYASTILANANVNGGLNVNPKKQSPKTAQTTSVLSDLTSIDALFTDFTSADFWERVGLVLFGAVLVLVGLIILAIPAGEKIVGSAAGISRDVRAVQRLTGGGSGGNSEITGPTEEEKQDRERRLSLAERNAETGRAKVAVAQQKENRLDRRSASARHKTGREPNPNPPHT